MININGKDVNTRRSKLRADGIIKLSGIHTYHDMEKYRVYGYSHHAGRQHINNKRAVDLHLFDHFEVVYNP